MGSGSPASLFGPSGDRQALRGQVGSEIFVKNKDISLDKGYLHLGLEK